LSLSREFGAPTPSPVVSWPGLLLLLPLASTVPSMSTAPNTARMATFVPVIERDASGSTKRDRIAKTTPLPAPSARGTSLAKIS